MMKDMRVVIPRIRTTNKFSVEERTVNINANLSHGIRDISEICFSYKDKEAVIVGGAPSVDNYIEKIKELKTKGGVLMVIERMYPWCHTHGLTPDYVVVLDACDDVMEGFTHINKDTIHLIATQCNPKITGLLNGYKKYVFTTIQEGIDISETIKKNGYKKTAIINGGGSVTICATALAYALGLRKLHIFGFDCHVTHGEYAKGIAGVGNIKNNYEVDIENHGEKRIFLTNNAFLSFMQQFHQLHYFAQKQELVDSVRIYGDSMVKFSSLIPNIDGDKT